MILAITHPDDSNGQHVVALLRERGVPVETLDLAGIPREIGLSLPFGPGAAGAALVRQGAPAIRAEDLTAVWWRRPQPYLPHAELAPAVAAFAFEQCHAAASGLWGSLDLAWMNEPWAEERASHKPTQLAAAEAVGLTVPPTLVTSVPDDARAFLARLGDRQVIHKPLRPREATWRPTRVVGPSDLARLDDLRFAPAILQGYVAGVDVRVTVVGERLFAADIDATGAEHPEDFRLDYDQARFAAVELPAVLTGQVQALMARLGLAYGALDFRRDADGRFHFLEVNTSGQWLFVEKLAGLPISGAIADWLADPPRPPSATGSGRR